MWRDWGRERFYAEKDPRESETVGGVIRYVPDELLPFVSFYYTDCPEGDEDLYDVRD